MVMITKRSRNNFVKSEVFRDVEDHQLYVKFSINKKRKCGKEFLTWLGQCSYNGFTIRKYKWVKKNCLIVTVKPNPGLPCQLNLNGMEDVKEGNLK